MIRETGSQSNPRGENSITLSGSADEIDSLRAAMLGACYIRSGDDGKLERVERFRPAPEPADDPMIPPSWALKVPPVGECTVEDLDRAERERVRTKINVRCEIEPDDGWHSPAVIVQHLCAGMPNRTEDSYRRVVQTMFDAGFECLRSRRGRNGRFWEVWFLPYAGCAEGRLAEVVKDAGNDWKNQARAVIDWLIHNVPFGSADVTVQRAALTFD